MVKFLLSLPLGIFIAAEAIVVYMLGDIIFKAATDSTAAGLVGEWNFFQIVLAMVGITVGIILAAFFYSTVVLKPVFYPTVEEVKPKKQKRMAIMPEPKKKSKKTLIILLILGALAIALGVTGFIFRDEILSFIAEFTAPEDSETDGDNAEDEDNMEEVTTEPESEPEPEEVSAIYEDLDYNWTLYYPASLGQPKVEPIETGLLREPPSDTDIKLLYWSTDNANGYAGAEDYSAADPSGILSTAINFEVLNDNVVICRFDSEDLNGDTFSGVRFWYIEPDGIASVDISCETEEKANEWYGLLANGAVYIERMDTTADSDSEEETSGEENIE